LSVVGWAGVVLCVAATVWVWSFSREARESIDRVAGKVVDVVAEVGEASRKVEDQIGESRGQVETFGSELKDGVADAVEGRGIDPKRLRETTDQLRSLSETVHNWLGVAKSSRAVIGDLADAIVSFGQLADESGEVELRDVLATGLGVFGEVEAALDELAGALEEARTDPEIDPPEFTALLGRFDAVLIELARHTRAFSDGVANIEAAMFELWEQSKRKVWRWSLIAIVFLLWQAVAQCALALWGRRIVAGEGRQVPAC
jgi:NTP pyrophosphatase (non-canonical NTP hydrolase)